MLEELADRMRRVFRPKVTVRRTVKVMTDEEIEAFDAAFEHFDKGFAALRALAKEE